MRILARLSLISILFNTPLALAQECANCCDSMGGISYCDSSAGRYVCKNGDYSACYCTIHAVMDLQKIAGCCLWQGGVFQVDELGLVICNNGSISEICSMQKTSAVSF
jgi:hypothetical protein